MLTLIYCLLLATLTDPVFLGANLKTSSVEDAGILSLVWNIWNFTVSLLYLNMSVLMELNAIVICYSGNNKEVLP